MKVLISIVSLLALLCAPAYADAKESGINVVVNGEAVAFTDQNPLLIDDVTYVPFRAYAEKLGAEVSWDDEHKVVTIINSGLQETEDEGYYARYYLKIGEPQLVFMAHYKKNDLPARVEIFDMPNAPIVSESGRTMLPFRAIGELLGALVWYDSSSHTANAVTNVQPKNESMYPMSILSTVTAEYFRSELEQFRIENVLEGVAPEPAPETLGWYNTPLVKNPGLLRAETSDELTAASTWKALDLHMYYDHLNSDGKTKMGKQFFALYMKGKYPYGCPYGVAECISPTLIEPPLGMKLIHMTPEEREIKEWTDNRFIYYVVQDIDAYLDDSEYWYGHLKEDWGIKMVELTEQSDLVVNGKSYSKYKMNTDYQEAYSPDTYKERYGYNFHSFSLIRHWNDAMYRTYAREDVQSWGHSAKGHRFAILQPGRYLVGYGTQIRYKTNGSRDFGNSALLVGAPMNEFQLEMQKKEYLEKNQ